ncbi:MAG: HNH endonuclease [Candidatus Omnitrophica bacterium]|nr:HNH endonuclease [Candidatus Omnitrophota bacterium]
MHSKYLESLNKEEREALVKKLLEAQNNKCYICGETIDLILHKNNLAIDHIEPLALGGKDDPSNFAITHLYCNSTKQAADLRVARVLAKFEKIKEKYINSEPNHPNLGDMLKEFDGAKYELPIEIEDHLVRYSFPELGKNQIYTTPLFYDELSKLHYFFIELPIEYISHDDQINPRAISGSLRGLVEEFFKGRPQLHISLGWIEVASNKGQVKIFDGQHKAVAQILLGVRKLPVRVFLNPPIDLLITTNTNAGTILKQVAFDKSVQRYLGSTLYLERIRRYQRALGKNEEDYNFSEKDLMVFFKGERREIKRYILDDVRNGITHHPENRLRDFIDFGGRAKEKPLSYSSIEKTFYSFFIYQDLLSTSINDKVDIGENPRVLEKEQIVRLMNIIADEIYIGKFDPDLGAHQIEKRLQKGEDIPEEHLRAVRMSKEEVLYNWLDIVAKIIKRSFLLDGKPFDENRLFQYKFREPLWDSIRKVVKNIARLSIWKNKELSAIVFGGRQNYDYWRTIFETGKTPQGYQIMPKGIDLDELLKD